MRPSPIVVCRREAFDRPQVRYLFKTGSFSQFQLPNSLGIMVFESIVADLLNKYLGEYVENLDRSQLQIGIWGGESLWTLKYSVTVTIPVSIDGV